jgi:hypothetical protein
LLLGALWIPLVPESLRLLSSFLAAQLMYRLVLTIESQALATEIYFKKKETGEMWLKHHYLLIASLVFLLRGTRDVSIELQRVS